MFGTATGSDWLAVVLAAVPGIIGAFFAGWAKIKVDKVQQSQETTAQQTNEVHAAVTTPPEVQTVGVITSEALDTVKQVAEDVATVKDTVTGHTPPGGTPEVNP